MSLYSALTQVLAPFAAKIKGIQTGYDGTEYSSPGEAVRGQINDLHVLIGDVPGAAIQASAVVYGNSNVAAELTNVNGRLDDVVENFTESNPLELEIGGISGGNPSSSTIYVRTKTFNKANAGDVLRVAPTDFEVRGCSIYFYTTNATSGYTGAVAVPTTTVGNVYSYKFTEECYFKVRSAKNNYETITDADVLAFESVFTQQEFYKASDFVKSDDITELEDGLNELTASFEKSLVSKGPVQLEPGGFNNGRPISSTKYARPVNYIKANKNSKLTISPSGFSLKYSAIYLYNYADVSGYTGSVAIPTVTSGDTYEYVFTDDCYFKFRLGKNEAETVTDTVLAELQSAVSYYYKYTYNDFAPSTQSEKLVLDYDAITAEMAGKVNFAVQTDTHMSLFANYHVSGDKYSPSDLPSFERCINAIGALPFDGFFNLGDIVRGYEFDPDYETRESIDYIVGKYCDAISAEKVFVIGNHDDGNLFYHNTVYNDNQNIRNVLFPMEQFNRFTKHGVFNNAIKNYSYKDINGVRIITLYQRDTDYSVAVPNANAFSIGQDQLTWLSNTALNTNLPVVVLTHAPLVTELFPGSGAGFTDAVAILKNFVNGGGTLIAVLCGHTHAQNYAVVDGINHIVFKNGYHFFEMITIDLNDHSITCKAINNSSLNQISLTY